MTDGALPPSQRVALRIVQITIENWKRRALQLKTEIYALYLAYRDPRTPLFAKIFAGMVVAYAFSPIDLIPDPIPILGLLDDLILLPIGIAIAIRMIPDPVLAECRENAGQVMAQGKPVNKTAAAIIVAIWILFFLLALALVLRLFDRFTI